MTLVELVISLVVFGIIIAGIFGAWAFMEGHSADPVPRAQAIAIAESYLEEIRLKRYEDLGSCPPVPPPGGRARYTHTCHYQGLVDAGARDQFGNPITGLGAYTVQVAIAQSGDLPGIAAADAQRILVTVDGPNGETISLSTYRTRDWP
jgi:MSHA pilin protein MshD